MGVGGQRHVPAALLPGKRPGTHFIEGSVGSSAFWTAAEKLYPTRTVQRVASRYTDCAISTHDKINILY